MMEAYMAAIGVLVTGIVGTILTLFVGGIARDVRVLVHEVAEIKARLRAVVLTLRFKGIDIPPGNGDNDGHA
jgi:hypothetical protein